MERLTERTKYGIVGNNNGVENFPLYSLYDETYLDHGLIEQCFNKLAEYEDLEEQGLLLRLPCKVGSKVYVVGTKCMANLEPNEAWCDSHDCCECVYDKEYIVFESKTTQRTMFLLLCKTDKHWILGKTVFLTKEEAEQALARMEKENG